MTSRVSLTPPYPAASMALWLDASRGVIQSNGLAAGWLDLSGNNNNGVQAAPSNQTSLVSTDIPQASLLFSCNDADTSFTDFVVADSASLHPGTGSYHLWTVVRMPAAYPTTHTIHGPFFDKNSASPWTGGTGDGFGLGINVVAGVGQPIATFSGHTSIVQSNVNLALSTMYLLEYLYDGIGTHTLYVNGVGTVGLSGAPATAPANNALTMGSTNSGVFRGFRGNIFAQGINIPAPSTAAMIGARRTLAARYGLTVP